MASRWDRGWLEEGEDLQLILVSSRCLFLTQATKVAGTLLRAVRWSDFKMITGERHMECAYYFDTLGYSLLARWVTPCSNRVSAGIAATFPIPNRVWIRHRQPARADTIRSGLGPEVHRTVLQADFLKRRLRLDIVFHR